MSTRNRRGALQVATDIWHHPGQDKTVTLVGVCHIADQAFWDDTQDIITGCQELGNEVHFEGTLRDIPDDALPIPDYQKIAAALGLTAQQPGLTYDRDTWKRTDVTMSFLLASADPRKLAKYRAQDWDHMVTILEENPAAARAVHWLMRRSHYLQFLQTHLAAIPKSIILGYRNRVAAQAALATEADVVALWGAAHLPGIGDLLRQAGYHRDYRIWRTAINPPRGKHT